MRILRKIDLRKLIFGVLFAMHLRADLSFREQMIFDYGFKSKYLPQSMVIWDILFALDTVLAVYLIITAFAKVNKKLDLLFLIAYAVLLFIVVIVGMEIISLMTGQ